MQRKDQFWDYVVKMYQDKLGIPEDIVNLLSVIDILKKSVEGLSNEAISIGLDTFPQYVCGVLEQYLDFSGWQSSLDFSPLGVYNRVSNLDEFIFEVEMIDALALPLEVNLSYELCKKYKELESKIDAYYTN